MLEVDQVPGATEPNLRSGARPTVAIVMNVQTPYRIHLHQRIVREVPGIRLASLYTHDEGDQAWLKTHIEEINPVYFGRGDAVADQGHPRRLGRDWKKG